MYTNNFNNNPNIVTAIERFVLNEINKMTVAIIVFGVPRGKFLYWWPFAPKGRQTILDIARIPQNTGSYQQEQKACNW